MYMYMVTNKRQKATKYIYHKIVYFRLYARLPLLGTIISGTYKNEHTTQITQLLFDNCSQIRWFFSFAGAN